MNVWSLVRNSFGLLLLSRLFLVSASLGSMPYLLLIFTDLHGLSSVDAGVLMSVALLAGGGASFPAGLAVDRFGPYPTLIISSLTSMGCLIYLAAPLHGSFLVFGVVLAVQGGCIACHIASLRTAVATMVSGTNLILGFGMSDLARIAGLAAGPVITAPLIATKAYGAALMVAGVLYGFGGVCAMVARWLSEPSRQCSETSRAAGQTPAPAGNSPLAVGVVSSAFLVHVVASAGIIQMTTWMPKYFSDIGQDGMSAAIIAIRALLMFPLLLPVSAYLKKWEAERLFMVMSAGALGLSASYILVATTGNPLVSAGVLIGGWLLVGLTVAPIAQVFVVQISPSQRTGFAFGLLGLGESIGAAAGISLGTYLYSRAQQAGELSDYWLTFGFSSAALVCVGALWGLGNLWASREERAGSRQRYQPRPHALRLTSMEGYMSNRGKNGRASHSIFRRSSKMKITTKTAVILVLSVFVIGVQQAQAGSDSRLKKTVGQLFQTRSQKIDCQPVGPQRNVCPDGSVSFQQHGDGATGSGICGAVAAANLLATLCGDASRPTTLAGIAGVWPGKGLSDGDIHWDILRPLMDRNPLCSNFDIDSAKQNHLNLLGEKDSRSLEYKLRPFRRQKRSKQAKRYSLKNPVAVALRAPHGGPGHWVSVVGIHQNGSTCQVISNTWGAQYRTPCEDFRRWMKAAGNRAVWLDGI